MKSCFSKISESLEQKRLKQSFEILTFLLTNLSNWQLKERLNELEDNYKMMLRYLTDGVKDPQQEKIYHDLFRSVYQVADQAIFESKAAHSWSYAYEIRRTLLHFPPESSNQLVELINDLTGKITLNDLLDESEEKNENLQSIEKERETIESKVFRIIWTSGLWTADEEKIWSEILRNELNTNTLKSLIVSALILSLEELFDERKINLLLDACENPNEEIRQRALTGVLLFLRRYDKRLYLYPNISNRLQYLSDNKRFINDIRHIILQFILSRETEKITRIMKEEIIPGMMKINPLLNKKIRMDDLFGETGIDEKNPEWQNLIEESGLGDRLQEFTELQLEGADVMHSSFLHLKNFPFFNEVHHWFSLFVTPVRSELNNELDGFAKLLFGSSLLCNSDKYSFYFSIAQMSETYRKMIMGQFSAETSAIKEMMKEELPGSESKKIHPVARQYIQDLYRFYKLFPRRQNVEDIFTMKPEFYQVPSIAGFISDSESLTIIGEYYFHRNYFEEAADVFTILLRKDVNNETLLQKKGYCLQMMGKLEEALDIYLRAELLNSNNSWTIKKLAYCYRALKQPGEALSYYRKAEQLNPDNLSIQLSIGHCYLELKDYTEALKHYFKVEYLTNNKEKAWRPIAWCSFLNGKYEQALDYFRKIIASNPNTTDYLNAGHTRLAMGNSKEALELYKSALNSGGNSFEKFTESFVADIPDLLNAGVKADDIPIILDSLVYGM
ncbi:MAG: tetratricopeptide repeat protein [Dysgonamonadaceae bacterium]|jgi:tetratricopeptide (TPR) repeat protein|nr:tetratricopeptide repeat protein [Dysgonamonadaceae bacterium]